MIVVVIIALLAAVSIPLLRRARIQANETAAIATLKSVAAAEKSYRGANPTFGTIPNLVNATPPYISFVGCGNPATGCDYGYYYKQGYWFIAKNTDNSGYTIYATPGLYPDGTRSQGTTGNRCFCMSQDGIIKDSGYGEPACNGSPIAESQ